MRRILIKNAYLVTYFDCSTTEFIKCTAFSYLHLYLTIFAIYNTTILILKYQVKMGKNLPKYVGLLKTLVDFEMLLDEG